jgi:hypothetical protein
MTSHQIAIFHKDGEPHSWTCDLCKQGGLEDDLDRLTCIPDPAAAGFWWSTNTGKWVAGPKPAWLVEQEAAATQPAKGGPVRRLLRRRAGTEGSR